MKNQSSAASRAPTSGSAEKSHYIIFHSKRTRFQASGKAFAAGGSELTAWDGYVWTDKTHRRWLSNEDPFVWTGLPWLFSYCHATQLRRNDRGDGTHLQPGSRLFFCRGGEKAREGWLHIDTVFTVVAVRPWRERGRQPPSDLASTEDERWLRHLRHGIKPPGAHAGRYTYEATPAAQGDSFLPLGTDQQPLRLLVTDALPQHLAAKVPTCNPEGRSSYPLRMDGTEAERLLGLCKAEAVTRIVFLDERSQRAADTV